MSLLVKIKSASGNKYFVEAEDIPAAILVFQKHANEEVEKLKNETIAGEPCYSEYFLNGLKEITEIELITDIILLRQQ